nr:MAG TPA: hypothetical protein [Caudoviricetes sp.]
MQILLHMMIMVKLYRYQKEIILIVQISDTD